jgi:glycerate kinase
MVAELDAALKRLAEIIRRDLRIDVEQLPGAGAAGGLGAGLVAFVGGRLRPGAEMVLEALHLDERLRGVDLVLTGEGRIDDQTARFGKGPAVLAKHAHAAGIPVIAIGGGIDDEDELRQIFDGLQCTVTGAMTLDQALADARPLLVSATERALRLFATGMRRA